MVTYKSAVACIIILSIISKYWWSKNKRLLVEAKVWFNTTKLFRCFIPRQSWNYSTYCHVQTKIKVTILKVTSSYFHSVLNTSELSNVVTHIGLSFRAKISDYVIIKYSSSTSKLEVIYKLTIFTSSSIKLDHIQPKYLRLGRPKKSN